MTRFPDEPHDLDHVVDMQYALREELYAGPGNNKNFNSVFGLQEVGTRQEQAATNFRYSLAPFDIDSTETNSGNTGVDNGSGFAETGTNAGTAEVVDRDKLRYRPGSESGMLFTAAYPSVDSDAVLRAGFFDDADGVYTGHDGSDHFVAYRRAGTETKISQDDWDDPLDGTGTSGLDIDLFGMQVYRISFGYLGNAPISWDILTSTDEEGWYNFHKEEFSGNANTNMVNPTLPPKLEADSTGTNNARIQSGSWFAYTIHEGTSDAQERRFTDRAARTSLASSTNEHLITIRVKDTYQGEPVKIQVTPTVFNTVADSNQHVFAVGTLNADFGTALTYSDVNTEDSVVEVSKDSTTVSNGVDVGSVPIPAGGQGSSSGAGGLESRLQAVRLNSGDTLSVYVFTPGTPEYAATTFEWAELF